MLIAIIAVHTVIGTLVMAKKNAVPQSLEMPLMIDLLPSSVQSQLETRTKSLPVVKPQTLNKKIPQNSIQPTIEATNNSSSSPQAIPSNSESRTLSASTATESVTSARFDADYLKNPPPAYPITSRRIGEEGKVVLRVLINTQGAAEQLEVKTSSGSSRLDDAALQTVRTWKFTPAKRGDMPIESWVMIPINFKLEH